MTTILNEIFKDYEDKMHIEYLGRRRAIIKILGIGKLKTFTEILHAPGYRFIINDFNCNGKYIKVDIGLPPYSLPLYSPTETLV